MPISHSNSLVDYPIRNPSVGSAGGSTLDEQRLTGRGQPVFESYALKDLPDTRTNIGNTGPVFAFLSEAWIMHIVVILGLTYLLTFVAPQGYIDDDLWNVSCYVKLGWLIPIPYTLICFVGLMLPLRTPKYVKRDIFSARRVDNLYILTVTKGDNKDAVMRSWNAHRHLEQLDPCIRVHVLTDEPNYFENINCFTCPKLFQTENSKYKARALEWYRRTMKYTEFDWILHLDEESVIDDASILRVLDFVKYEKNYQWGQGVILYNQYRYWTNWIFTVADAIRVSDDLARFHLQYTYFHAPVFGAHGSFLLTNGAVENAVTWDLGSLTEDFQFAVTAWNKGYKCGAVAGFVREQSPMDFEGFMKQRRRWYVGIRRLPLFLPKLWALFWTLGIFSLYATFASLLMQVWIREGTPRWIGLLKDFSFCTFVYLYMLGIFVQDLDKKVNPILIFLKLPLTIIIQFICSVMECMAVMYGIAFPPTDFDIAKAFSGKITIVSGFVGSDRFATTGALYPLMKVHGSDGSLTDHKITYNHNAAGHTFSRTFASSKSCSNASMRGKAAIKCAQKEILDQLHHMKDDSSDFCDSAMETASIADDSRSDQNTSTTTQEELNEARSSLSRMKIELEATKRKLAHSEGLSEELEVAKELLLSYGNDLQSSIEAHTESLHLVFRNCDHQYNRSSAELRTFNKLLTDEYSLYYRGNKTIIPKIGKRTWEHDSDWDSDSDLYEERYIEDAKFSRDISVTSLSPSKHSDASNCTRFSTSTANNLSLDTPIPQPKITVRVPNLDKETNHMFGLPKFDNIGHQFTSLNYLSCFKIDGAKSEFSSGSDYSTSVSSNVFSSIKINTSEVHRFEEDVLPPPYSHSDEGNKVDKGREMNKVERTEKLRHSDVSHAVNTRNLSIQANPNELPRLEIGNLVSQCPITNTINYIHGLMNPQSCTNT